VQIPQETAQRVADAVRGARAEKTWATYVWAWNDWARWCARHNASALPAVPEAVAAYLVERGRTCAFATLSLLRTVISIFHRHYSLTSPTRSPLVAAAFAGERRRLIRLAHPKSAAAGTELVRMIDTLPADLFGVRDRALLLVGFSTACRRSELAGLRVEDLTARAEGYEAQLGGETGVTKTDQEGRGRAVSIARTGGAYCPATALEAWLRAGQIREGPLFRAITRRAGQQLVVEPTTLSGDRVARIVKRVSEDAGLDYTKFSGHSLRAGHVTEGYLRKVDEASMQAQTGHKSVEMLRRYRRITDVIAATSAKSLKLEKPAEGSVENPPKSRK
jgi:integrase